VDLHGRPEGKKERGALVLRCSLLHTEATSLLIMQIIRSEVQIPINANAVRDLLGGVTLITVRDDSKILVHRNSAIRDFLRRNV